MLALPAAKELLTRILGERAASDEESALTRLAELCEGLPLALRIIGNRLVSRPGWDAAELAARLADEERRLDQFKAGDLKVASAFGMSYEQLGDSARRVFRRLAVVPGRDFDATLARSRAGCRQDSAAGRYRFHDLVRFFARARLQEESLTEREALIGRVTSWLLRMATMAGQLHHEQARELIAVLGDSRVASRDDSGVVIGHRRRLAPHAGDVFPVRADGRALHRRASPAPALPPGNRVWPDQARQPWPGLAGRR